MVIHFDALLLLCYNALLSDEDYDSVKSIYHVKDISYFDMRYTLKRFNVGVDKHFENPPV